MKFVEDTESAWSAEQLAAAEAEIEQQKKEWELGRLAALRDEESEKKRKADEENEDLITYAGTDARNQVYNKSNLESGQNALVDGVDPNSPRTRSHGRVSIDLWTLDESPIPQSKPSHSKKLKLSTKVGVSKKQAISPVPVPPPYSNPNLVIRTRRASAVCAVESNHVEKKVARLGRIKRKSEGSVPENTTVT